MSESRRRLSWIGVAVLATAVGATAVSLGIRRRRAPAPAVPARAVEPVGAPQVARISATLFFRAQDDESLVAVRREVPLGDGVDEQGRRILEAELQAAAAPFPPLIAPGTTLRAFYVTNRGDAFVDLSAAAATAHPGGSTAELLTVYAIVNAVTANLPTVKRVQILVDGKQVDTLAGHIDLRRPLAPDISLVKAASVER